MNIHDLRRQEMEAHALHQIGNKDKTPQYKVFYHSLEQGFREANPHILGCPVFQLLIPPKTLQIQKQ